ncbi:sirohydrochlorin chelatase [Ideonella paludis]|uniref:CbiX/SirB N-terminal domain-containing protein n=1 Tax=Ideonella paludis TaxID=1233411 RepID=A0ABS5DUK0_9BURK|nr:CbiX/SirB N-terminal domain-containing protein [Ideonella paludis]MBQ0934812.1 CbiX/SirB N-terminal domain-containing protein [Ideonella paludis]
MQGIILFAHGARLSQWAEPFERVAQSVRAARPDVVVELAFLEFMSPDLAQCGQGLVEQGCQRVDVLPLFLGAGGHVRKDLPERVEELATRFPEVVWTLRAAAGESDLVVQALAQLALQIVSSPQGDLAA